MNMLVVVSIENKFLNSFEKTLAFVVNKYW
jgi:hypothetical protein